MCVCVHVHKLEVINKLSKVAGCDQYIKEVKVYALKYKIKRIKGKENHFIFMD